MEALSVPFHVASSGFVEWFGGAVLELDGIDGGGAEPFADLGMAIGEGESARAVMIGSGPVLPMIGVMVSDEEGVVDRVRVFIKGQPSHGGFRNVGGLEELAVLTAEGPTGTACAVIAGIVVGSAEERVHGHAAQPHGIAGRALLRADENIGGALINTDGAVGVFAKDTIADPEFVSDAAGSHGAVSRPSHDIIDPVVEPAGGDGFFGAGDGEVIGDSFVVVSGIEVPAEDELFVIAETHDALGLSLGLAQRRQEHTGQDGDDGNDYQQFDEGEGTAVGRAGWGSVHSAVVMGTERPEACLTGHKHA